MADRLTKEHRSWNMSRIRSHNTKPEILVRSVLHRMGFRFRLNSKIQIIDPKTGKKVTIRPDVVLRKHKIAVFVHGCFWHRHKGCKNASTPSSNQEYWQQKFEANVKRDKRVQKLLQKLGWKTIVIWECQTRKETKLEQVRRKLEKLISLSAG